MELLVQGELARLAAAAERDLKAGRVEALEPPGPCRVLLSSGAAQSCRRMRARERRLLRDSLVRGEADDERLLWLSSGRWVAAFSYVDEATVLVHQAFEARELERALVGEEIWRRRQRIAIDRGLHGRAWWQIAGED